jgi:hypothetical protein
VRKVSENICTRHKYVLPREMRCVLAMINTVLLLCAEVNPFSRECVSDLAACLLSIAMRRYNMILKKEGARGSVVG